MVSSHFSVTEKHLCGCVDKNSELKYKFRFLIRWCISQEFYSFCLSLESQHPWNDKNPCFDYWIANWTWFYSIWFTDRHRIWAVVHYEMGKYAPKLVKRRKQLTLNRNWTKSAGMVSLHPNCVLKDLTVLARKEIERLLSEQ